MTTVALTATGDALAAQIARYITELRYEDLPPETVAAAKDALLDQLGIMLMGSTLPWTVPVRRVAEHTGRLGDCTVLGWGDRFSALDAAVVNANYAHSCELDDSGYSGGAHSGALSVPVALALSEEGNRTGRDLLLAIVTGYEVLYRIGRVLSRPAINTAFTIRAWSVPSALRRWRANCSASETIRCCMRCRSREVTRRARWSTTRPGRGQALPQRDGHSRGNPGDLPCPRRAYGPADDFRGPPRRDASLRPGRRSELHR